MVFKKGEGNWTQYGGAGVKEVDFHWMPENRHPDDRPHGRVPYQEKMGEVHSTALEALKDAYEHGVKRVLFTHGHSTSRAFKMTARSVIRSLMRSKDATPFIIRRECVQHESVFLAVIRPKPPTGG